MIHLFNAKFAGTCWKCSDGIARGTRAAKINGRLYCEPCAAPIRAEIARRDSAKRDAMANQHRTKEIET